ncbi:MAG: ATP-binding protein [Acidimicrobiales bacterium]|jgi:two-component system, OmpR family, sensor histidine kinase MtrB
MSELAADQDTDSSSALKFGLQSSILFSFAIGGLALSLLLAGATLILARQQLVENREGAAAAIAVNNASRLSNQLTPESTIESLPSIVDSLTRIEGAQPVVRLNDRWLPGPEIGREDLPLLLRIQVANGAAGQLLTEIKGRPHLVIGIPLVAFDADYFEAVDLVDLDDTLRTLQIILGSAAAFTTLMGALVGLWASRRTLRPLRRVGVAAAAIAGGRLDTRLADIDDPDLDQLTQSFNEMAEALEKRIQRDARFASDVSHELRSPLTTLTSSVAVLEARRHELSERSRTALNLLSGDLTRFSRLVEDLLEISRFDAGAASLDLSGLKIHALLTATLRSLHLEKTALTENDGAIDLLVNGDKRRLGRVFSNLFTNALRYGNGISAVVISADSQHVWVAVDDHGPGVMASEREKIFERFSRGLAGGQREDDAGSGLGLSMVREDIRLHSGRVWVEERPDGILGARFVVELPRFNPGLEDL